MANQFINGRLYSWSSIEFFFSGIPLDGIKAINYDDGLSPGMPRGKGPLARGYTLGTYEANGDIELFRDQFDTIVEALGGPGFLTVVVPITIAYYEPGIGVKTDTLVARLKKNSTSNSSDSNEGTTTKHDLAIIAPILWNGVPGVVPL